MHGVKKTKLRHTCIDVDRQPSIQYLGMQLLYSTGIIKGKAQHLVLRNIIGNAEASLAPAIQHRHRSRRRHGIVGASVTRARCSGLAEGAGDTRQTAAVAVILLGGAFGASLTWFLTLTFGNSRRIRTCKRIAKSGGIAQNGP